MGIDYYAILDVPRTATIHDIKLAYRKLALRFHPHRSNYPQHPNPRPEGVFDVPLPALPEITTWEFLNEAYDALSDPLRREVFDKYGEEGLKQGCTAPEGYVQPYCYHFQPLRTYYEFFCTYSPFADLIDAATNPPRLYHVKEGTGVEHKDPPTEHLLDLDLEEVFHGGMKLVKFFRNQFTDETKTAMENKEVTLSVQIPPGIPEGTRLTYAEHGDQSLTRIAGDVIFVVSSKPHKVYVRDKCDLHMDREISLKEALTGFKLKIATLDDRNVDVFVSEVVG